MKPEFNITLFLQDSFTQKGYVPMHMYVWREKFTILRLYGEIKEAQEKGGRQISFERVERWKSGLSEMAGDFRNSDF